MNRIEVKNKLSKTFMLLFISLCLLERLYNNTEISGKYSIYITILLILFSFIYDIISNKNIYKFDKRLFLLIPLVLYFPCIDSIRYMMFFCITIIWGKYVIKDLHFFSIMLIIIGFIFSAIQLKLGTLRISGFMYSPTLFSCVLVIFNTYLLFEKKKSKVKYFFIFLSTLMIWQTGSSSSFICILCLIIYKIIINIILSNKEKNKSIKKGKKQIVMLLISIAVIITGIYIVTNLNDVLSIINRSNRDASTITRTKYLTHFIYDFFTNIRTFFIGQGAGYTQEYLNMVTGFKIYTPLHQDLIMLLCEYGIIGFYYIYNFFIKNIKFNWLSYIVLILCTFHNIVLASQIMVLLIIINNSLCEQYKNENIWF